MRSFIKIYQDASIYERYPTLNTGLDEILEVGKHIKSTDTTSKYSSGSVRTLLSFIMPTGSYVSASNFYLNLHIANITKLNRYQKLDVHLVSSSWQEGSGYFYQDTVNSMDGVTWKQSDIHVSWSNQGGDYLQDPVVLVPDISASYKFNDVPVTQNIRIDITRLLRPIISASIPNLGVLLKLPTVDEQDQQNTGNIKFFSTNTHTIFAPKLEVTWDDQLFVTGSLKPILNDNLVVTPRFLKQSYFLGEIDKIYLIVRDAYPDKRFDAVKRYRNQYYLPSSSYFRIRDVASGTEVFKFDNYSTINCDHTGSYFILNTEALQVNRYYAVDLKVKTLDQVFFPEFTYTFKIETDD